MGKEVIVSFILELEGRFCDEIGSGRIVGAIDNVIAT